MGSGAYPSANLGFRAVPGHSRSSEGEGHLSEVMQIVTIRHTEMVEQFTVL
jgi:hypothetical protein